MKSQVLDIHGKKVKDITLPPIFSTKIRKDVVAKVLESKKTKQPYSPSPVGGKQHSASGKIRHRRHVWQTHYGRGISRIPRKVMSRRGTQFNWVGAEINFARGGRRAHPPKIVSMINTRKVNKKELRLAFASALSATADNKIVVSKYERLIGKNISSPFIVEGKITALKTKDLLSSIKNIFGDISDVAIRTKTTRAGKGKMRGRRYKKSAGLLIVLGEKENMKSNAFEIKNVKNLGVLDLAKGGLGRLTLYTEQSINELNKMEKSNE